MSKIITVPLLLALIFLLFLLSISKENSLKIRSTAIALSTPLWAGFGTLKEQSNINKENRQLQIENQLLMQELSYLQELLQAEIAFHTQFNQFYYQNTEELYEKHLCDLKNYFDLRLQAIPAKVIYRASSTWNSFFWINVGSADNLTKESPVIAKNSPVLADNSVIGIIDYVGKKQSLVRLITDSGLNPSVRVLRQSSANAAALEYTERLMQILESKKDFDPDIINALENLKTLLTDKNPPIYLAKGELKGSSQPLWRTQGTQLKGVGFNYDFADEQGKARDLRTGKIEGDSNSPSIPLLQLHDLLVTTGMDGVFPSGLKVAEITKIHPLKEGDYYYEIEARPIVGNLNEMDLVFVIPPLGYDKLDKPLLKGR